MTAVAVGRREKAQGFPLPGQQQGRGGDGLTTVSSLPLWELGFLLSFTGDDFDAPPKPRCRGDTTTIILSNQAIHEPTPYQSKFAQQRRP